MVGKSGDDFYFVDSDKDACIEDPDGGEDKVIANVSYKLQDDIENLELSEDSSAKNGAGNSLNNRIRGNKENNNLTGSEGADYLSGRRGPTHLYTREQETHVKEHPTESQIFMQIILKKLTFLGLLRGHPIRMTELLDS